EQAQLHHHLAVLETRTCLVQPLGMLGWGDVLVVLRTRLDTAAAHTLCLALAYDRFLVGCTHRGTGLGRRFQGVLRIDGICRALRRPAKPRKTLDRRWAMRASPGFSREDVAVEQR